MTLTEAKRLIKKIKYASFTEAVKIMAALETKDKKPYSWINDIKPTLGIKG